jgi:Skp family chaperone for outer membrane proteins
MRILRMAAVALAVTVGGASLMEAQEGRRGGGRGMGGVNVPMLLEGITLTDAQQAKADSLVTKFAEQQQALRAELQGGGGDMQTAMGRMTDMRDKQLAELKAILTEDQQKVFDKNVEALQARMQQGRGRGAPPAS